MEITLLRHGKPNISHQKKLTASSFSRWVESYNLAGLSASSKPTIEAIEHSSKCNAVICSKLLRSKESAKALKINNVTFSSELFNEAGLPIANWELIKLSPKLWAVLFRVLWLFGYSNKSESYKEAKTRASESANILIELAKEHKSVLFIGHGVYNRLLSSKLLAAGWSGAKSPNSNHWGYSVYKKT